MHDDIAKIRKDYKKYQLLETNIDKNPFTQFGIWLDEAIKAKIIDNTFLTVHP